MSVHRWCKDYKSGVQSPVHRWCKDYKSGVQSQCLFNIAEWFGFDTYEDSGGKWNLMYRSVRFWNLGVALKG